MKSAVGSINRSSNCLKVPTGSQTLTGVPRSRVCAALYDATTKILGELWDAPFDLTHNVVTSTRRHSTPTIADPPQSQSNLPVAGPSWWKDEGHNAGLYEGEFPLVVTNYM